jgi:hypothetical protein
MSEPVVTYKFYTEKGERLAVFCRYLDYNKAEIFTLRCSINDFFSKKLARNVYKQFLKDQDLKVALNNITYHPLVSILEVKPEKTLQHILVDYCLEHFCKKIKTVCSLTIETLIKL